MSRGRLEQLGTPREIYEAPRSRFVAEFVGLSNFLEGRVETVTGDVMTVAVGALRLRAAATPGMAPGASVVLFLRPAEVAVLPVEATGAPDLIPGRVESATYLGDKVDYRVSLGTGVTLRVQGDPRAHLSPGGTVGVRLPLARGFEPEGARSGPV